MPAAPAYRVEILASRAGALTCSSGMRHRRRARAPRGATAASTRCSSRAGSAPAAALRDARARPLAPRAWGRACAGSARSAAAASCSPKRACSTAGAPRRTGRGARRSPSSTRPSTRRARSDLRPRRQRLHLGRRHRRHGPGARARRGGPRPRARARGRAPAGDVPAPAGRPVAVQRSARRADAPIASRSASCRRGSSSIPTPTLGADARARAWR